MSCNIQCGCLNPMSLISNHRRKPLDPCWIKYEFSNNEGEYTIEKAGIYQVMLSSNGANILNALELEKGTAFIIADLQSNTKVTYSLGNSSTATIGSYNLDTPVINNNTTGKIAGLIIRYIGEKWNSNPVQIIPTSSFYNYVGSDWKGLRYSDGVNPWEMHNNSIVPNLSNWKNYPNMKEHWYYVDIKFPSDGDYTFRILGDDVGQMLFDGKPIIWGKPSDSSSVGRTLSYMGRNGLVSSGGHTTIHVTKGTHQIIVYNKQTGGASDANIQSIKDSNGTEIIPDLSIFRKIEKTLGCNNDPVIPIMIRDTNGYYVAGSGTYTNM